LIVLIYEVRQNTAMMEAQINQQWDRNKQQFSDEYIEFVDAAIADLR
jgi:hypothetical protein